MQAATDRRANEGARVPLDLWIRLAHEDYEDTFDADGVDISSGGLALRSEYLPEVGDRLRCRFDCPPTGDEVEVDGEVVWAHDAGERKGEFGLSFGRLGDQVQESLRQLVTELGGEAGTVARLHLDGVISPIEAEILERDSEWLTVEQELPFLEIGMGVTIENGGGAPRGRLASVDLRIENGTPRLVLAVELDRLDEEGFNDEEGFDDDEEGFDDDEELVDGRSVKTLDEPDEARFAADGVDAELDRFLSFEVEVPFVPGERQPCRAAGAAVGELDVVGNVVGHRVLHGPGPRCYIAKKEGGTKNSRNRSPAVTVHRHCQEPAMSGELARCSGGCRSSWCTLMAPGKPHRCWMIA